MASLMNAKLMFVQSWTDSISLYVIFITSFFVRNVHITSVNVCLPFTKQN